jgi:glycolate oxidase
MNASLLTELRAITGPSAVITSPEELHTYDSDALTNFRTMPQAVLLPSSTAEVQLHLLVRSSGL